MGSYLSTSGSLQLHNVAGAREKIAALKKLCEDLEEDVLVHGIGTSVIDLDLNINGECGHSTASAIEDAIKDLGPYCLSASRISDEWESQQSSFVVGKAEQVAILRLREVGRDVQTAMDEIAKTLVDENGGPRAQFLTNRLVSGEVMLAVTRHMVDVSAWFTATPLPDDHWRIDFKIGEGREEMIDDLVARYADVED